MNSPSVYIVGDHHVVHPPKTITAPALRALHNCDTDRVVVQTLTKSGKETWKLDVPILIEELPDRAVGILTRKKGTRNRFQIKRRRVIIEYVSDSSEAPLPPVPAPSLEDSVDSSYAQVEDSNSSSEEAVHSSSGSYEGAVHSSSSSGASSSSSSVPPHAGCTDVRVVRRMLDTVLDSNMLPHVVRFVWTTVLDGEEIDPYEGRCWACNRTRVLRYQVGDPLNPNHVGADCYAKLLWGTRAVEAVSGAHRAVIRAEKRVSSLRDVTGGIQNRYRGCVV